MLFAPLAFCSAINSGKRRASISAFFTPLLVNAGISESTPVLSFSLGIVSSNTDLNVCLSIPAETKGKAKAAPEIPAPT